MSEEKWKWIDLLSNDISQSARARRTYLSWTASTILAGSALLWLAFGILERGNNPQLPLVLVLLGLFSYLGLRFLSVILPNGLTGLADFIMGFRPSPIEDPDLWVSVLRLNLDKIRSRIFLEGLLDLIPVFLLLALHFMLFPLPPPAVFTMSLLVVVRVFVFLVISFVVLRVLTHGYIEMYGTRLKHLYTKVKESPAFAHYILKLSRLSEIGRLVWTSIIFGTQWVLGALLVVMVSGATSNTALVLFLFFIATVLFAGSVNTWRHARECSIFIDNYFLFRYRLLTTEIAEENIAAEYSTTGNTIRRDIVGSSIVLPDDSKKD